MFRPLCSADVPRRSVRRLRARTCARAPNNRRRSRRASEIIDNDRPARLTAAAAVVRTYYVRIGRALYISRIHPRPRAILKIPVRRSVLFTRQSVKVAVSHHTRVGGPASFHGRLARGRKIITAHKQWHARVFIFHFRRPTGYFKSLCVLTRVTPAGTPGPANGPVAAGGGLYNITCRRRSKIDFLAVQRRPPSTGGFKNEGKEVSTKAEALAGPRTIRAKENGLELVGTD